LQPPGGTFQKLSRVFMCAFPPENSPIFPLFFVIRTLVLSFPRGQIVLQLSKEIKISGFQIVYVPVPATALSVE